MDGMQKQGIGGLLIRPACEEDFQKIRNFLLESSSLYPDIENWWRERVIPAARQGRRVILVVDSGSSLEGLFIGKPGSSAKLCTLRLRDSIRNQGIGRVLVTEGLRRLLAVSPTRFHVTVSEGAEEGSTAFFESVGFRQVAIEKSRYVSGLDEFIYSCPRDEIVEVIHNVLTEGIEDTLFGVEPKQMPYEQTLLMSLRPQYADLILNGKKTIELRRRFCKKYEGATIVFYVTHPVKQFMFTATASQVDHRPKELLWDNYREQCGVSKKVFDEYFLGTANGYAITLSNIEKLSNRLMLRHAKRICPQLRIPQSFQKLEPQSPLVRALELPVHV